MPLPIVNIDRTKPLEIEVLIPDIPGDYRTVAWNGQNVVVDKVGNNFDFGSPHNDRFVLATTKEIKNITSCGVRVLAQTSGNPLSFMVRFYQDKNALIVTAIDGTKSSFAQFKFGQSDGNGAAVAYFSMQ